MRNRVRLGLAVVALAFSASSAHAIKTTPLDERLDQKPTGPDVAKTPSPGGPVPIPYPNVKDPDNALKKKELGPKFDDKKKKPIEIVKPDVPKPEKIPPVDLVKRPPQTPPLRPVEVPHPVKLPQPVHRPVDLPKPVLLPVELPAKPVVPIQPIEPVKAQPVVLQPAVQMPVQR